MARNIAPGLSRSLLIPRPESGPSSSSPSSSSPSSSRPGGAVDRRAAPVAPGAWPFQRWVDYDPAAWREAVEDARGSVMPWRGRLLGVELHEVG